MSIDNIGLLIKSIRKEKGYTLKELSQKVGISISFLSDIENGRSNPSVERLVDIALALETPVSFFLGDNQKILTFKKTTPQSRDTAELAILPKIDQPQPDYSNIKDISKNTDMILAKKDEEEIEKNIEKAKSIIDTFKKVGINPEEIDLKELEILLKGYYLGKDTSK